MKWRGRRQSENVVDRRGARGRTAAGGGILFIILAIVVGLMGGDPRALMQQAQQQRAAAPAAAGGDAELSDIAKERGEFVSTVLADSEEVWTDLFRQNNLRYEEPRLTLFSDRVQSACGAASAASGPFYCPADKMVYLDTTFFDQLARQLGAPGDFAQAYVVAHEVGHHIQNLLGKTSELDRLRQRLPETEYNKYSVKLELQADFYAGVMFHHAQKRWSILEQGDIEEGLRAASAIGDDKLQRRGGGHANQETFTHGTSEQRVRWFMKGLQTGDPGQGDTFAASSL